MEDTLDLLMMDSTLMNYDQTVRCDETVKSLSSNISNAVDTQILSPDVTNASAQFQIQSELELKKSPKKFSQLAMVDFQITEFSVLKSIGEGDAALGNLSNAIASGVVDLINMVKEVEKCFCDALLLTLMSMYNRLSCLLRNPGNLIKAAPTQCSSQRFYPARGTKPLKRYFFDEEHLKELLKDGYTHQPLHVRRLGGRHPETGRKVNQHVGGGTKFDLFIIDFHRRGPAEPGKTYDEKVLEIRKDPYYSPFIALVAGSRGKRWIFATENMKAGDIISTSGYIPENPVIGVEGNAYPLGALADGTFVNCVERRPTMDSEVFIRQAGTCGQVVRRQGDYVVVRLPHKHEFAMHETCMATIGKLSNAEFANLQFGSAQMHRRFGFKQGSGLWHKKTGYDGRKVRPLPPTRTIVEAEEKPPENYKFTLTKRQMNFLTGSAAVHPLISKSHFRF